jgi:hypothetical protein
VLLTAQRVVSPVLRTHGVNVYRYIHGHTWRDRVPDEVLPDEDPGELVQTWEPLPGGGNRVVGFLDLVTPDEIAPVELHQRLASLKYRLRPHGNPTIAYWDDCWVRFGTATRIPFQTEVGALAGTILLRLTGH